MKETNLTEFRENLRDYYVLAASGKEVVKVTNRKSKNGDAVLISAELYDEFERFRRFRAYSERLAELDNRVRQLEEKYDEK